MNTAAAAQRPATAGYARKNPDAPPGFVLLGFAAACLTLLSIFGLVAPMLVETPAERVALRAAAGLVAVTSLLAVEAFWWARPWAFQATAALFLSVVAAPVVLDGGEGVRWLVGDLPGLVMLLAAGLAVLAYVRYRIARLFGVRKVAAAPRGRWAGTP